MRAVLPLGLLVTTEPQPCLMDQRGGLQRLCRRLVGHLVRRQLPQFLVNKGQEPFGTAFAPFDCLKNLSDVIHVAAANGSEVRLSFPPWLSGRVRTLVFLLLKRAFHVTVITYGRAAKVPQMLGSDARGLRP